jgi:hypothetical protein
VNREKNSAREKDDSCAERRECSRTRLVKKAKDSSRARHEATKEKTECQKAESKLVEK